MYADNYIESNVFNATLNNKNYFIKKVCLSCIFLLFNNITVAADIKGNSSSMDSTDISINVTVAADLRVELFNGYGEVNVGPDGILGTSDDASGGIITNGNYSFANLLPGTYNVQITVE